MAGEETAVLVQRGRAEVDDDGRLTGIHGLTLRPTRHRFVHDGRIHHTWCAFDSIGIPAALRIDAEATTNCPSCQRPLQIEIRGGLSDNDEVALWLPPAVGEDLMADFCASADLYCSLDHLQRRIDTSATPGEVADLAMAVALGCATWADVTDLNLSEASGAC